MSTRDSDSSSTITETRTQGLQSICRTCLRRDSDLIPIDSEILDISLTILSLLESCVALKVDETDDLPKQVCSECLGELVKIHCFKNKCHQNENILKLKFKNIKAETMSVKSEAEKFASDSDNEEQSGLEDVDNSFLNFDQLENDFQPLNQLENKIFNIDDKGNVTVLTNASVQLIDDPVSQISDDQLSSDLHLEHQYSRQLDESEIIIIKHENEELEEFNCKICHKSFTSKKRLQEHAKRFKHSQVTKNIPKDKNRSRIRRYTTDFKCEECETVFNNRNSWKRHILKHKNILEDDEEKSENLQNNILKGNEEKSGNFQCKICGEIFTTKKLLGQHAMQLKHCQLSDNQLKMCEICAKTIDKRKFNDHMRKHTREKKDICEKCGAAFSSSANLRRHILRHTGEKHYVCDVCGKDFASAFSMKVHKRAHTITNKYGNPPYTCKICFCEYKSLHLYEKHVSKKHQTTDSKSSDNNEQMKKKSSEYRCELCNKTFATKITLRKHGLVHGDKNFKCTLCGKAFFFRYSLEAHLRGHTGDHPYKCHICSKGFTIKGSYVIHMRLHTGYRPYNCTVCNKKFTQPHHLSGHMTTHTREKLHQCTFCEKSFALKINLIVHMRTHTGDRPYKCPECEKGFYDSSSRRRHCLKSHGLELERTRTSSKLSDKV